MVFHAPYNKLVSKTFGRVLYHDFLTNPAPYYDLHADDEKVIQILKKYESVPCSDTTGSREVIKEFERIASKWYKSYVAPSTVIPKQIGNCYTASIFMGLLSLIVHSGDPGTQWLENLAFLCFADSSCLRLQHIEAEFVP